MLSDFRARLIENVQRGHNQDEFFAVKDDGRGQCVKAGRICELDKRVFSYLRPRKHKMILQNFFLLVESLPSSLLHCRKQVSKQKFLAIFRSDSEGSSYRPGII